MNNNKLGETKFYEFYENRIYSKTHYKDLIIYSRTDPRTFHSSGRMRATYAFSQLKATEESYEPKSKIIKYPLTKEKVNQYITESKQTKHHQDSPSE